jgi:flagellar P-ring protein precursor FlgI
MPAIRPLRELLARLGNPINIVEELKEAKNVAIVMVEATLPENGVREGDRIDVQVSSVGAAKSLAQGRLVMTPLLPAAALSTRDQNPESAPAVLAFASGPLTVADPKSPRTGTVRKGAAVEASIIHSFIATGAELEHFKRLRQPGASAPGGAVDWIRPDEAYVTLVIDDRHAGWAMANIIAQMINDDSAEPDVQGRSSKPEDSIAMAIDRSNVIVRIPPTATRNPAPFLARLETLDLVMPPSEARVIVNRQSGSVIITGDVEISPVVMSFNGMTISTIAPEPKPTPEAPLVEEKQFASLDPSRRGGTKLKDLVEALNSLKIPAAERVHIVEQLHRMGKLHAKLIVEE